MLSLDATAESRGNVKKHIGIFKIENHRKISSTPEFVNIFIGPYEKILFLFSIKFLGKIRKFGLRNRPKVVSYTRIKILPFYYASNIRLCRIKYF